LLSTIVKVDNFDKNYKKMSFTIVLSRALVLK